MTYHERVLEMLPFVLLCMVVLTIDEIIRRSQK